MIKRWTFPLITPAANAVMRAIHNAGENKWRMPLFLSFDMSQKWVAEKLSLEEHKAILNFMMPSNALEYFPVWSIRTPKSRPSGKAKNEFYQWDNLQELVIDSEAA